MFSDISYLNILVKIQQYTCVVYINNRILLDFSGMLAVTSPCDISLPEVIKRPHFLVKIRDLTEDIVQDLRTFTESCTVLIYYSYHYVEYYIRLCTCTVVCILMFPCRKTEINRLTSNFSNIYLFQPSCTW